LDLDIEISKEAEGWPSENCSTEESTGADRSGIEAEKFLLEEALCQL
jgi:hypothetical protein